VLVATVPDCPQHRSLRAVGQLSNQHGMARRELAGKRRGNARLNTCPQVSFVRYQTLIGRHLGFGEGEVVACGMSMGHADPKAPVNAMKVPREPVSGFARLAGFEDWPDDLT